MVGYTLVSEFWSFLAKKVAAAMRRGGG